MFLLWVLIGHNVFSLILLSVTIWQILMGYLPSIHQGSVAQNLDKLFTGISYPLSTYSIWYCWHDFCTGSWFINFYLHLSRQCWPPSKAVFMLSTKVKLHYRSKKLHVVSWIGHSIEFSAEKSRIFAMVKYTVTKALLLVSFDICKKKPAWIAGLNVTSQKSKVTTHWAC